MSHFNTNYRNKIKSIQDFELKQYDNGDSLEVLIKKFNTISYKCAKNYSMAHQDEI
jgi:hypothetical protein